MTWCRKIGAECPVPSNLEKLKYGELPEDCLDLDIEGPGFSKDKELIGCVVPLVEYLGKTGSCDGPDTDAGREEDEIFVSCDNGNRIKIDFITNQFGIYLCSTFRPEKPTV